MSHLAVCCLLLLCLGIDKQQLAWLIYTSCVLTQASHTYYTPVCCTQLSPAMPLAHLATLILPLTFSSCQLPLAVQYFNLFLGFRGLNLGYPFMPSRSCLIW